MTVSEAIKALHPLVVAYRGLARVEEVLRLAESVEADVSAASAKLEAVKAEVRDAEEKLSFLHAKAAADKALLVDRHRQASVELEKADKAKRDEIDRQMEELGQSARAFVERVEAAKQRAIDQKVAVEAEVADLKAKRDELAAEIDSLREKASAILK
jgi:chromosome segregation ATPase